MYILSLSAVPQDLSGKRVLVVDDNKTNRTIICEILKSFGSIPDEAWGGFDCIEKMNIALKNNTPYDIVILDMEMPDIDGEATGRKIKSDSLLCNTILIMLSSITRYGDGKLMKEIGFASHLTKPVKSSHLYDCMSIALGLKVLEEEKSVRRKGRILVAEDNTKNQEIVLHLLEKHGYRADVVGNGKEVIENIEKFPYDLILMDIEMPEMNGLEASEKLRERGCHIPIIAMTGYADRVYRERCLNSGMNEYITKPLDEDILISSMEKLIIPIREKKVLVVDDDFSERELITFILEKEGYDTDTASDGKEALEKIEQTSYSLVLMDIQMAGMNGLDASLAVREREDGTGKHLPIIAVTAYTDKADRMKCITAGMDDYLIKPVEKEYLLSIVKKFTGKEIKNEINIIIAEDNVTNQEVVLGLLRRIGYEADIVCNGYELIESLKRKNYDLIFMDMQMPEMDGLEAASVIRKKEDGRGEHIPIIAMTAHVLKEDRKKCFDAGMDGFITKPVDLEQLKEAVEKVERACKEQVKVKKHYEEVEDMVFDSDAFLRRAGSKKLYDTIVSLTMEDIASEIEMIREGVKTEDMVNVKRCVHSLKGVCANISANRLKNLAWALEQAVIKRREIQLLVPDLEREFNELKKAVKAGRG